jgi:hypothetical protein
MEELGTSSAFREHRHRTLIYGVFYWVPIQRLQDPIIFYNREQDLLEGTDKDSLGGL